MARLFAAFYAALLLGAGVSQAAFSKPAARLPAAGQHPVRPSPPFLIAGGDGENAGEGARAGGRELLRNLGRRFSSNFGVLSMLGIIAAVGALGIAVLWATRLPPRTRRERPLLSPPPPMTGPIKTPLGPEPYPAPLLSKGPEPYPEPASYSTGPMGSLDNTLRPVSRMPSSITGYESALGAAVAPTPLLAGLLAKSQGALLRIPSDSTPQPQDMVLNIKDGITGSTTMFAYFSERSEHPGIFLETSDQVPIAFLDTSNAPAADMRTLQTNRSVAVRRAISGGWDNAGVHAFLRLSASTEGYKLLASIAEDSLPFWIGKVNFAGSLVHVSDAMGRPVAAAVDQDMQAPLLQVQEGADAALVVCMSIAAQKLR